MSRGRIMPPLRPAASQPARRTPFSQYQGGTAFLSRQQGGVQGRSGNGQHALTRYGAPVTRRCQRSPGSCLALRND